MKLAESTFTFHPTKSVWGLVPPFPFPFPSSGGNIILLAVKRRSSLIVEYHNTSSDNKPTKLSLEYR